jgi:hypothetical protein
MGALVPMCACARSVFVLAVWPALLHKVRQDLSGEWFDASVGSYE